MTLKNISHNFKCLFCINLDYTIISYIRRIVPKTNLKLLFKIKKQTKLKNELNLLYSLTQYNFK